MSSRENLASDLAELSRDAAAWQSPMYSAFTARMREDVLEAGPSWRLLEPYADEPVDEYYPFRALAGVHHMVLGEELPDLAKHYPSVGGDGDAEAAWPLVREELGKWDAEVLDSLRHPLQTPLDPASDHDRLALLSYIFPDQMPRYELLREAIDVAREYPIEVERAGVDEWAGQRLAEPAEGMATVVFHSLVWIYLGDDVRNRVSAAINAAAERANQTAPLAWLRYEIGLDPAVCELRLTAWPGGEDRLLATGDVHLAPVTWLPT